MSVSRSGKLYYTDEELEDALRNNNALQYALSRGYPLVRSGSEFRFKEHDSMVFKADGRWYWNSKGVSGRALDFIQHYENKDKIEAVCILAGTINRSAPVGPIQKVDITEQKKEFVLPERAERYNSVFAYLTKHRAIDESLVKRLVEEHKIYQAITYNKIKIAGYDQDGHARYTVKEHFKDDLKDIPLISVAVSNNALPGSEIRQIDCLSFDTIQQLEKEKRIYKFNVVCMVGYDKEGKARYASLRSMNTKEGSKSLKIDVDGSDKSYPFIIEGHVDCDTLCVFESPLEAASYWSICKATNSERQNYHMISLGGAATQLSLERFLKDNPHIKNIIVGLNNDEQQHGHKINAGLNGTKRIQEKFSSQYQIRIHKPHLNDWNDVLRNFRQRLQNKIAINHSTINRPTKQRTAQNVAL